MAVSYTGQQLLYYESVYDNSKWTNYETAKLNMQKRFQGPILGVHS